MSELGKYGIDGDSPTIRERGMGYQPRPEDVLELPGTNPAAPTVKTQHRMDAPSAAKKRRSLLQPGQSFGKYTINREIARGGMGVVYEAEDPVLRRSIALKVLISGEGADERAIKRFVREARASSKLKHPHIVPVHDAGEIDNIHFFTMDLIRGKELADVANSLTLRQKMRVMYQVTKALQYAHENGIYHRDLKPGNIMLTMHGHPFVMDFGLAKDLSSNTLQSMSGAVFGTPAYMSPEQAKGLTHEIDHRTDIYSLGAILYAMATGQQAFRGETMYDTMFAVVNKEPESPQLLNDKVDPALEALILRCLEKNPDRRYQQMREVGADLLKWLEKGKVDAKGINPLRKAMRRMQDRPWLKTSLIAGVPALVVLIIVLVIFSGDSLLATMKRDLGGDDPNRASQALGIIENRFQEGRWEEPSTRRELVQLAGRWIGSGETKVQGGAMAFAARHGDGTFIGSINEIMLDPEAPLDQRQIALRTLQEFSERKIRLQPRVDPLWASFMRNSDEDQNLRRSLIYAVLDLTDDRYRAQDLVIPVMRDESMPRDLRLAAILSIASDLALHDRGMLALMRTAGSRDPVVAQAADKALSGLRTRGSVFQVYGIHEDVGTLAAKTAALQTTLNKRNQMINELAKVMESDAGGAVTEKPPEPQDIIAKGLHHQDAGKRMAACYDLGQFGNASSHSVLMETLDDQDADVRSAASRAIVKLGAKYPPPLSPVTHRLRHLRPEVRSTAAQTLGMLKGLGDNQTISKALGDRLAAEPNTKVRAHIIDALGAVANPAAVQALRDQFTRKFDVDGVVIITAWQRNNAWSGKTYADLVAAIRSPQPEVREAALEALQNLTGETWTNPDLWDNWLKKQN